ncbi:camp-regulated phosphoprotein family protein Igo1 [Ilyonectria robusta]|uniref:camp-regulated phosphoprotein family protein Igo1 n=1 Tax=Ilyonectria robusta TaxID=1079257 RepID=UPI001E8CE8CB|nr:camp-regulated phosphoprotein family protein Igo1 [Ilyonectria robusta]KAH8651799.1 camp-regulated phosphoprotein family protein Igo1 [Ilyonectria robusta]
MDPPKNAELPTEKDKRLLRRYGTIPTGGNLLHHQLEGRKYFDSGDFALSQSNKPSNIGTVNTGSEHPLRENIPYPSSAVPSSSNVDNDANQNLRDGKKAGELMPASHLEEVMAAQAQDGHGDTKQENNV